jgi:chromate transporter
MHLLTYFWLFLKASLLSTGGTGNLPSLHYDLVGRHWATDKQFAESLTIGQISPGPTGLWVISLGYLTAGVPGSVLAFVAIVIPPLLAILVKRIHERIRHLSSAEGFMQGLALSVCGIFVVILCIVLQSTGLSVKSAAIAIAALVLAATKKVPIPVILAVAAIAGMVI